MWRRGGRLEGDGLVRLTRDFLGCDDAGIHKTKEIELNKNNISFNGREKKFGCSGMDKRRKLGEKRPGSVGVGEGLLCCAVLCWTTPGGVGHAPHFGSSKPHPLSTISRNLNPDQVLASLMPRRAITLVL
jgi:hypothetical protein